MLSNVIYVAILLKGVSCLRPLEFLMDYCPGFTTPQQVEDSEIMSDRTPSICAERCAAMDPPCAFFAWRENSAHNEGHSYCHLFPGGTKLSKYADFDETRKREDFIGFPRLNGTTTTIEAEFRYEECLPVTQLCVTAIDFNKPGGYLPTGECSQFELNCKAKNKWWVMNKRNTGCHCANHKSANPVHCGCNKNTTRVASGDCLTRDEIIAEELAKATKIRDETVVELNSQLKAYDAKLYDYETVKRPERLARTRATLQWIKDTKATAKVDDLSVWPEIQITLKGKVYEDVKLDHWETRSFGHGGD